MARQFWEHLQEKKERKGLPILSMTQQKFRAHSQVVYTWNIWQKKITDHLKTNLRHKSFPRSGTKPLVVYIRDTCEYYWKDFEKSTGFGITFLALESMKERGVWNLLGGLPTKITIIPQTTKTIKIINRHSLEDFKRNKFQ